MSQSKIQNPKSKIQNGANPKSKIVQLVSSLQVGGMEHFVVRMAAAQKALGHDVTIMAIQAGGALRKEAEALGLPVVELGGAGKGLRVLRGMKEFLRLRPDIIHVHNTASLHYALIGKRVSGAKIVMTAHGRGKGGGRSHGAESWAKTDAVVAVSRAVGRDMAEVPGNRLSVILNGVEPTAAKRSRQDVRAELGIGESEIVGIIVARIDAMKGHDDLIAAWEKLQAAGKKAILLIAGDGEARTAREKLARDNGLDAQQVQFLGFRNDAPDLLAACDFFLLPSLTEGLPLSVLEAMAQGLPVVATDVGGIPELVTDGVHGLLVPPKNPDLLASAIEKVVDDAALRERFGEAGKRRVTEEFSFDTMIYQYEAVYGRFSGC